MANRERAPLIVRFGSMLVLTRVGLTMLLCSLAAQMPLPPVLGLSVPPIQLSQWHDILALAVATQLLQVYSAIAMLKMRISTLRLFLTAETTTFLGAAAATASGITTAWSVAALAFLTLGLFTRFEVRHHFAVNEYLRELRGHAQSLPLLFDGYRPKDPTVPPDRQVVGYVAGLGALSQ